mgnify:FL=1
MFLMPYFYEQNNKTSIQLQTHLCKYQQKYETLTSLLPTPYTFSLMDSQLAISAALEGRFSEALKLNQHILKDDPKNVDALNRLARAYFELGKLILAKKYYNHVLEIDSYNPIAQKNLKIIKAFKGKKVNGIPVMQRIQPALFLQEPGKTKVVEVMKVAEPNKLSQLFPGQSVKIVLKKRTITVVDQNDVYLGVLPDDLAYHLIRLCRGGNKFQVYVKSVRVNGLSLILKEVFRSKRFKNQPSFLPAKVYHHQDIISLPAKGESIDLTSDDEEEGTS